MEAAREDSHYPEGASPPGYPLDGQRTSLGRLGSVTPKAAPEHKKLWLAYMLWLPPLGIAGCHHYYLGRTWYGIFYTFFLGNFLLGWIADCFRMKSLVTRRNEEIWMMKHYDV